MKNRRFIISFLLVLPLVILSTSCRAILSSNKTSLVETQMDDKSISYSEIDQDLNKDGVDEKIRLIYKNGLYLKIDNTEKNLTKL